MAITFLEKTKVQKYLIPGIVLAVSLLFIVILYRFFFISPLPLTVPLEATLFKPAKIEIDWEVLKDPRLDELQPFEEIPPYTEKIGREIPFFPYSEESPATSTASI